MDDIARIEELELEVKHLRALEHELTSTRVELEAIIRSSLDGMIAIETSGHMRMFNLAAENIFGYASAEVLGKDVKLLMPDDVASHHGMYIQRYLETGVSRIIGSEREVMGRRCDGSLVPLAIRIAEIKGGSRPGFICMVQDISPRKRAEAELALKARRSQHAEKLEALGTMASGIAHDFNNLLLAVLASICLLEEDLGSARSCETTEHLEIMRGAVQRAGALIQHIQAFARQTSPALETTDLAREVRGAVSLLRASLSSSIVLSLDLLDEPVLLLSNAAYIYQLIMNLGINSTQAMPEGGELHIAVRWAPGGEGDASRRVIQIEVRDTGVGIAPEILPRIYDPFFSTREVGQGTGMGLSIVHGIVEGHQGEISVESTVGEGTCFRVCLPTLVDEPGSDSAPKRSDASSVGFSRPWQILLVEDEPRLARATDLLLRQAGARPSLFLNPEEALQAFQCSPNAYDVAILDHNMPSLTGSALAEALRVIRPDIPVILCSGGLPESVPEIAHAQLQKPFTRESLIRVIERLVSQA